MPETFIKVDSLQHLLRLLRNFKTNLSRTFCVSQERANNRTSGLKQGWGGGGGRVTETWERSEKYV